MSSHVLLRWHVIITQSAVRQKSKQHELSPVLPLLRLSSQIQHVGMLLMLASQLNIRASDHTGSKYGAPFHSLSGHLGLRLSFFDYKEYQWTVQTGTCCVLALSWVVTISSAWTERLLSTSLKATINQSISFSALWINCFIYRKKSLLDKRFKRLINFPNSFWLTLRLTD